MDVELRKILDRLAAAIILYLILVYTAALLWDYRRLQRRHHFVLALSPSVGCHTWRATGITIYLENDGRLEHAQQMAGHESPRTTKLYDRTKDEITLSEVERIRL